MNSYQLFDFVAGVEINPLAKVEKFIFNHLNVATKGDFTWLKLHERADLNPEYPTIVMYKQLPCVALPIQLLGMKQVMIKWENLRCGIIQYVFTYTYNQTKRTITDGVVAEVVEEKENSYELALYFSIHPEDEKILVINGVYFKS